MAKQIVKEASLPMVSFAKFRNEMKHLIEILLTSYTYPKRKRNLIWGNNNYEHFGPQYKPDQEIKLHLINGRRNDVIVPRSLKEAKTRRDRTRKNAEVFTPTWVVNAQVNEVDKLYKDDDLQTYLNRRWLEVTCGEAPYIATRYDMQTGQLIDLNERVGFLDRKLQRLNNYIHKEDAWIDYAEQSFKACYGFEWNGDSLLIARENLLYTFYDYYFSKWDKEPSLSQLESIAKIISYNLFQMDGVKKIVPLSEEIVIIKESTQRSLFDNDEAEDKVKKQTRSGKHVMIMNWETNKLERFR